MWWHTYHSQFSYSKQCEFKHECVMQWFFIAIGNNHRIVCKHMLLIQSPQVGDIKCCTQCIPIGIHTKLHINFKTLLLKFSIIVNP